MENQIFEAYFAIVIIVYPDSYCYKSGVNYDWLYANLPKDSILLPGIIVCKAK